MDATVIIPAVVVGLTAVCTGLTTAGATLAATVLVIRHQYQGQVRERKRERLDERFREVRRWVVTILRAADAFCDVAEVLDGESRGGSDLGSAFKEVQECLDAWDYSPVAGSAKVTFAHDRELRRLLEDFDDRLGSFGDAALEYAKGEGGGRDLLEELRGDLVQMAQKLSERMEQVLDGV